MKRVVSGTFKTQYAAEEAIRRMESIGVDDSQISLIASEETRAAFNNLSSDIDDGDNSDDGASAGATAGGLLGMVFGALMTAGVIAIPGLNVVVSGPLFGALAGLAAGAGAGGLLGALVGAGLSEDEANFYESEIRSGNVLISVRTDDATQEREVQKIFDEADINSFAPANPTAGTRLGQNVRDF